MNFEEIKKVEIVSNTVVSYCFPWVNNLEKTSNQITRHLEEVFVTFSNNSVFFLQDILELASVLFFFFYVLWRGSTSFC